MKKLFITNISKIVSGDINNPILEGDSVLVVDGKISKVGFATSMEESNEADQIDATNAF